MFRRRFTHGLWFVVAAASAMAFVAAMRPAPAQGKEKIDGADHRQPPAATARYYVANPQDGTLVPIVPAASGEQATSEQFGALVPLVPSRPERAGLIDPADISLERLRDVFRSAFLDASINSDGEILIVEEGVKVIVRLDPERQMIHFASLWRLKPEVPFTAKLELVNRWNRELTMVKFWLLDQTVLVTEYDTFYKDGLTPGQVINVYRWFFRVTTGAIANHDPDDVVGVRNPGGSSAPVDRAAASARRHPKAA